MPARNKKNFRSTKSGAGMTRAGVATYQIKSRFKLKTAVTGKVKKGSKAANRRKSFCARSAGQMKKFPAKAVTILIQDYDRHGEDGNVKEKQYYKHFVAKYNALGNSFCKHMQIYTKIIKNSILEGSK